MNHSLARILVKHQTFHNLALIVNALKSVSFSIEVELNQCQMSSTA